jgi:hypothetical protein
MGKIIKNKGRKKRFLKSAYIFLFFNYAFTFDSVIYFLSSLQSLITKKRWWLLGFGLAPPIFTRVSVWFCQVSNRVYIGAATLGWCT